MIRESHSWNCSVQHERVIVQATLVQDRHGTTTSWFLKCGLIHVGPS